MPTTFLQWSQPCSYDNGSLSSIAINDSGTLVEVHEGPDEDEAMYYRLGQYATAPSSDLSSYIAWQPVQSNGSGHSPSVDVNKRYAVQVYQDSDKNLYSQWAALPAMGGQLGWSTGVKYTDGEYPAVAMNNNDAVVAVHQDSSIFSYTLWICTGLFATGGLVMNGAVEIIQSNGDSISGDFVQVAMNDTGTVVIAYRGGLTIGTDLCQLYLIAGTMEGDSVTFGEQFTVPLAVTDGNSFDVALDNQGNLVLLCSTSTLGQEYLGWISGTVSGNAITLSSGLPLPLGYTSFIGNSVTVALNNAGNLVAETGMAGGPPPPFQYFVGQAYFNADFSHWMGDNLSTIGDIPLNLLALPGTHDSGTFAITPESAVSPDNPDSFLSHLDPASAASWACAQDLGFLDQLNAGIRYLDLRVCYSASLDGYYLAHGLYGGPLSQLFSDIQAFYAQDAGACAKEILLLDINHVYTDTGGISYGGTDCWMPGGPAGQFPTLCSYINDQLGALLLPRSLQGKSLNQILASPEYQAGGRVLLFMDDTYSVEQNPAYWCNVDVGSYENWVTVDGQSAPAPALAPQIASYWPNATTLPALTNSLAYTLTMNLAGNWSTWVASPHTAPVVVPFTVLQCIGTPGNPQVEAGLLHTGPPSLQSWEVGICSPSLFWLAVQPNAIAVNVVLADWLEQTLITPLCIALNRLKADAVAD